MRYSMVIFLLFSSNQIKALISPIVLYKWDVS